MLFKWYNASTSTMKCRMGFADVDFAKIIKKGGKTYEAIVYLGDDQIRIGPTKDLDDLKQMVHGQLEAVYLMMGAE